MNEDWDDVDAALFRERRHLAEQRHPGECEDCDAGHPH